VQSLFLETDKEIIEKDKEALKAYKNSMLRGFIVEQRKNGHATVELKDFYMYASEQKEIEDNYILHVEELKKEIKLFFSFIILYFRHSESIENENSSRRHGCFHRRNLA